MDGTTGPGRLRRIYLEDHLAGATAGRARFRAAAAAHRGTPTGEVLERLSREVAEDVAELEALLARLGVPPRRAWRAAAAVGERLARLKPNGRWLHRSRLASVVDLEGLFLGVHGKGALWRGLRALAETDADLDAPRLEELSDRARRQTEELEALRCNAVRATMAVTDPR